MAISPFRRLCHWGPISVLGIIKLITWSMVHMLGMWWPPHASVGGTLNSLVFLAFAAATLYYFLQSLLEGPGFVPLGWKPKNAGDEKYLQFCLTCNGFKAPRSHHCSKCGRCVLKMDHHCPWINCCVGFANHSYFTTFLACAVVGCFQASVELSISLYHGINRVWYLYHGTGREPMVQLTLTSLMVTLLAVGMAIGVVLAVGALFYFQVRSILRNQTTIEDWIIEKANARHEENGLEPFVFPYDLGWRENLEFILNTSASDGINWPLKPGCGPYDLTCEQKAQKAEKRVRSRAYVAVREYSGAWLPGRFPRAAARPPCSLEPRLALRPPARLRATRRRRHWLYGELLLEDDSTGGEGEGNALTRPRGPRGWFPLDAVEPCNEGQLQ